MAYKTEDRGKTFFTIRGKPQTVEDFKREVEAQCKGKLEAAWREAVELVSDFDKKHCSHNMTSMNKSIISDAMSS